MEHSIRIQFNALAHELFLISSDACAYTKMWFEPVGEFIYVLKDGLDKDQFPLKDCAVYFQKELPICEEAWQQLPEEAARQYLRRLHYVVKCFGGTIERGGLADPDPTRQHLPDTRFWKRLHYYAREVDPVPGFADSVKSLREKGFRIAQKENEKRLVLQKPTHLDPLESKRIIQTHIMPFPFKEAFEHIEDYSHETLRQFAKEGCL